MYCVACSHPLADTAAFCTSCGAPVQPLPPPALRVNGKRFVVPKGATLPARCVKCANNPAQPWLNLTFTWHHPGLYALVISPIIYIIVAAIVRKTVKLAVPLCEEHKAKRKKTLWTGALLMLGCIPIPWALGSFGGDSLEGFAWLLGILMFLVGAVLLTTASPLKAAHIGNESAEFTGAAPSFLAAISHGARSAARTTAA